MVHSETYMKLYLSESAPYSFKDFDSDEREDITEETESGDSDDTSL